MTLKAVPNWTVEPYYFLLKDSRVFAGNISGGNLTAFSPQAPDQARNVLGGRINGKQGIAGGALDATLEAVWQFGGLSNVTNGQHNLHINAHAEALKVGYTFDPVPMKPRIGIEVDYASGDNCRRGPTTCNAAGHFNTFDNLYPTNHFHYGYMDLMAWKNMVNYQAVFDVKPDAVSKIQVNFIIHRLANHLDDWYRAGQVAYGVTNAANTASSLGWELDIH